MRPHHPLRLKNILPASVRVTEERAGSHGPATHWNKAAVRGRSSDTCCDAQEQAPVRLF